MLGDFSAPLQSYDPTIIAPAARNSPNTRENLGPEITPQLLDDLQKKSAQYFKKELNASQFRLRIPDEKTANFENIIDTKYQDIRSRVNQSLFFTRAQPVEQYSLRHIAVSLNSKKYDEVRLDVDKLYNATMQQTGNPNTLFNQQKLQKNQKSFLQQQTSLFQSKKQLMQQQMQQNSFLSIASVYSLLATILKGNYELESAALRQMEHIKFSAKDLPHFLHFLDELLTLPDNSHVLLSSFFIKEVPQLIQAFKKEPHPMPLISTKPMKVEDPPSRFLKEAFRDSSWENFTRNCGFNFENILAYNLSLNINDLMQLTEKLEVNDTMPTPVSNWPKIVNSTATKDPKRVPALLNEGKYIECIRLATTFIESAIELPNMYMYRSLCFYKINRIAEAIVDMTDSIDLEPTPEKYNALAGFWMVTGNPELAEINEGKSNNLGKAPVLLY